MTLSEAAIQILATPAPEDKIRLTREVATAWASGEISETGTTPPPDRPAAPERPELLPPSQMPKRKYGGAKGRAALLHALAHIEFKAIDLAWDIIARFPHEGWPTAFYDDWVNVSVDEALHFELLAKRLADLDTTYGDLPAHDGLWEAATDTGADALARLAIVPMTHEARGLDTTPKTMARLRTNGDTATVELLDIIYHDEIKHVAAGTRWFKWLCEKRGIAPVATYHALLRQFHRGRLKPPFNSAARTVAGMEPAFYDQADEYHPSPHPSP